MQLRGTVPDDGSRKFFAIYEVVGIASTAAVWLGIGTADKPTSAVGLQ